MENTLTHTIVVENKSRINATCISEVLAFSDKEIKLKLKNNNLLFIYGLNLKIACFDNKNGNFIAGGVIESVRYKDAQLGIVKKVFK